MYYAIYPQYDSTIFEKHISRNTGIDEILELTKISLASLDPEGGYWESTFNSRILMKYDISALSALISAGRVSASSSYYLNLRATQASDLPINYTINVHAVSQSWDNGNGSYYDNPELKNGVSWRYRDGYFNQLGQRWLTSSFAPGSTGSYVTNPGGATWYTSSLYHASQSLQYEDPDLRINVTPIVNAWLDGDIPNDGFIIKRSPADESSYSHLGTIKYFSRDTHTIYVPKLEAVWNSVILSGTGSFTEISSINDPVIHIKNIKSSYKKDERVRFRITVREQFPARTYSTSSMYLSSQRLPITSYFAVKDALSEIDIIPFDTASTQVSIDSSGNYIDIDLNAFQPERYYKIQFKLIQEGGSIERIVDNKYYFKVSR